MRKAGMGLIGLLAALQVWSAGVDAQVPDRWTKALAAFDDADRTAFPPTGEIVFVGSSTIQGWDVAQSFPGLKIVNRGVWGSSLADLVGFADRIVVPYEPRLVVVYSGDNDVDNGRLSEQVAVDFSRFVRTVHAKLPHARILVIAIKPTRLRWADIDRVRETNRAIRSYCERDDRLAFVDFEGVMLGWDDRPRTELLQSDGLHLSAEGYRLWSSVLRPYLLPQ